MKERYYIDERGGCIAVRDRAFNIENCSGLDSNTPDVVWFKMGEQVYEKCTECGASKFSKWEVKEEDREEARKLLNHMNKHNSKFFRDLSINSQFRLIGEEDIFVKVSEERAVDILDFLNEQESIGICFDENDYVVEVFNARITYDRTENGS